MGMALPSTGDIKTLPSSIPPVPGTCAVTGAAGAAGATGAGVTGVFLATLFWGSAAGVFSCF